ncbi:MAG: tRNA lysidine(34) synthetase TilS [Treponema sp.]|jgi:tRNA(Ile)-lysidine synthase|nr:tRNA lysidine(34) synthetase TilS [Treponema sp.]
MLHPFEVSAGAGLGNHPKGTVFLAAVSGGADSTAMLTALAALRPQGEFVLHCLHVDHGIRPPAESRGDADFVEDLCKKLEVPCRVISVYPGKIAAAAKKSGAGIEAAARLYRRRAWNREARRVGADYILVAHTRDDLLETALMRILRGSGPAGLAAMPARRGRILRPLLELSRAGVLRYLEEKGVPHRTDSTNKDTRFLRNSIRNFLVPLLDDRFPRWRGCLGALGETQRLTADFLIAEAASRIPWEKFRRGRELRTRADNFFSQPPIIREEALFLGINKLRSPAGKGKAEHPVPVKRSNLRKFSRGERALDLGFCRIRNTASQVVISGEPGGRETGFSLLIKAPGLYKLKGVTIELLPGFPSTEDEDGAGGFFVSLPVVFRRSCSDDYLVASGRKRGAADLKTGTECPPLCAADAAGAAAFIGAGSGERLVVSRRDPPAESGGFNGMYYCRVV